MNWRKRQIITTSLVLWSGAGLIVFLSGLSVPERGAPKGVELPWSGPIDYVESADGKIYVSSEFYSRVQCYDRDGRFLAAYSVPGKGRGGTGLAVGSNGLIYFRFQ